MATPMKTPKASGPTASEPKGGSGYLIYSGYYTERELNTKLNSDVKRFGQFASYGEAELMRHTDAILHVMSEVIIEPILSASIDLTGERDGVPQEMLDEVWNQLFVTLDQPFEVFERQALLDAPWYGFACFEEEWMFEDGKLRLARFHQRMPWTVRKWNVENGRLLSVEQWSRRGDNVPMGGAVSNVVLPAETLTLFVHDQRGDDFRGQGMFRSVHPLWFMKQEMMRARIIGHNRNASGVPYFKYDPNVPRPSGQDEDDARDFLQNVRLHEGSWVEPPFGAEPKWFINQAWAAQAKEIREDIESINGEMLMRFKHPALGLGIIGQGSRAVAEGQDSPRVMGIEGLARAFAATLNGSSGGADHTGVIRRIVAGNWADYAKGERSRPYPRLRFTGIRSRKLADFFTAVQSMSSSGIPIFKSIAEAAYNELGVELPTEFDDMDEELKKPPAPNPFAPPSPMGQEQEVDAPEPDDPEVEDDPEAEDEMEIAASRVVAAAGWKPPRELIGAEHSVSFAKINDRVNLGVTEFQAMIRRLLFDHADALADGGVAGRDGLRAALDALEADVEVGIDRFASDLAEFGYQTVKEERARQRAGATPEETASDVQDEMVKSREVAAARVPGEPGDFEEPLQDDLDASEEAATAQVRGMAESAVLNERANRGDAASLRDRMASAVTNLSDGSIRRTGLGLTTTAFSIGREAFARQFAKEIKKVQISEVMDPRTCPPCAGEDGRTFPFGSAEHDEAQPPWASGCDGGMMCRRILVYNWI